jgi:ParB-like chromosome segregation protein Spo0J
MTPAAIDLGMILEGLRPLAVPIEMLRPMEPNPHHGDVEALMRSWSRFGQRRPLVARRDPDGEGGMVTAGNHGLEAATRLGWSHVAVLWTDDSDVEAKAFAAADNRTAQLGYDDPEVLATLLMEVRLDDVALLAATSYDVTDLARLLDPDAGTRDKSARGKSDDTEPQLDMTYVLMVTCEDEAQQRDLMATFDDMGLTYRAVMA